jgi:hypothetical protein
MNSRTAGWLLAGTLALNLSAKILPIYLSEGIQDSPIETVSDHITEIDGQKVRVMSYGANFGYALVDE